MNGNKYSNITGLSYLRNTYNHYLALVLAVR
jgi:hypothetical protein